MTDLVIKRATVNDLEHLQIIGRQTFIEAFAEANTESNMQVYLSENFSINKLRTEIENENSEIYFASEQEKIIGYLKLNFGKTQTELQNNAVEIERIYVLKEFYGKKAGQILLDKAREVAVQRAAQFIWLGVWEKNPRAINFYKKNGFIEFDKHIFKLGDEEQVDLLMKLEL